MVILENPIGRSLPVSQLKPNDMLPVGPGSLSAKTRGSTYMIQYGIPTDSSAPTDPYRKRSSALICGCGTTRKKLYQANHARSASSTSTTMPAVCHLRFLVGVHSLMRTSSKGLQVLDDVVLDFRRERRAPLPPMSAVVTAPLRRVERPGHLHPLREIGRHAAVQRDRLLGRGHPAHPHRIDDVVAAPEFRRPLLRRLEQIAQRGHRAVVQVRAAQPDAVERHVGVAAGVAEMAEAVLRAGVERV